MRPKGPFLFIPEKMRRIFGGPQTLTPEAIRKKARTVLESMAQQRGMQRRGGLGEGAASTSGSSPKTPAQVEAELKAGNEELKSMLEKYKEQHPEIIRELFGTQTTEYPPQIVNYMVLQHILSADGGSFIPTKDLFTGLDLRAPPSKVTDDPVCIAISAIRNMDIPSMNAFSDTDNHKQLTGMSFNDVGYTQSRDSFNILDINTWLVDILVRNSDAKATEEEIRLVDEMKQGNIRDVDANAPPDAKLEVEDGMAVLRRAQQRQKEKDAALFPFKQAVANLRQYGKALSQLNTSLNAYQKLYEKTPIDFSVAAAERQKIVALVDELQSLQPTFDKALAELGDRVPTALKPFTLSVKSLDMLAKACRGSEEAASEILKAAESRTPGFPTSTHLRSPILGSSY